MKLRKKLWLFPLSGNSIEALDCVDDTRYEVLGFIDDDIEKHGISYGDLPVVSRQVLQRLTSDTFVLAVSRGFLSFNEKVRLITSLDIDDSRFTSVIHQRAVIGKNVKIGRNSLIMAGAVITSNAQIGSHCCVLPNTVIHHDCIIENYVSICGGVTIAGRCHIKQGASLGAGCTIKNDVIVGEGALVGSGANVINNVVDGDNVAGNPARSLR